MPQRQARLGEKDILTDAKRLATAIALIPAAAGVHNILSPTHTDAATVAAVRGDIIIADNVPQWTSLAIGAASTHLESDGVDLAWQANLTMADDAWIGLGGAAGRLVFDSTPAPDQLEVTAADLNFVTTGHGIIHVDGVSVGPPRQLLIADGTRYIPGTLAATDLAAHNLLSAQHGDTVVQAVSRGSLVYGDATPAWNELVHPAAAGYALTTTATDVAWDQTPTWTGNHAWDDGAGDSPSVNFVGGSNNDTALIFLDDDAVATDSDLVIRLCDAAGDSHLIIQDSAPANVLEIDSNGNVWIVDGATIGQAAGPLMTFDDTNNYLEITGAYAGFNETTPTCQVHITQTVGAGVPALMIRASTNGEIVTETNEYLRVGHWNSGTTTYTERWAMDNNGYIGWGITTGADGPLHVHRASAGAVTATPFADELIVENSGEGGMSVLVPDDDLAWIVFGHPTDDNGGGIFYDNDVSGGDPRVGLRVGGSTRFEAYSDRFIPAAAKSYDLGDATHEWDNIYYVTANTGTSRLIDSTMTCPVCSQTMVKGTGSLNIRGEVADYELVFCLNCGNVAMETRSKQTSEMLDQRQPPTKVVLTQMRTKMMGAHDYRVVLDFDYGDGVTNSTRLGDDELISMVAMTEQERETFLLELGQREWYAREESRVMTGHVGDIHTDHEALVAKFIGKDLLTEVTSE